MPNGDSNTFSGKYGPGAFAINVPKGTTVSVFVGLGDTARFIHPVCVPRIMAAPANVQPDMYPVRQAETKIPETFLLTVDSKSTTDLGPFTDAFRAGVVDITMTGSWIRAIQSFVVLSDALTPAQLKMLGYDVAGKRIRIVDGLQVAVTITLVAGTVAIPETVVITPTAAPGPGPLSFVNLELVDPEESDDKSYLYARAAILRPPNVANPANLKILTGTGWSVVNYLCYEEAANLRVAFPLVAGSRQREIDSTRHLLPPNDDNAGRPA
jgi:hypothetical protein